MDDLQRELTAMIAQITEDLERRRASREPVRETMRRIELMLLELLGPQNGDAQP